MGIGKQHGFIASSKLGGGWVTTFENAGAKSSDQLTFRGYSVKMVYSSNLLSESGSKIRLTLRKPNSHNTDLGGLYIGESAGGNLFSGSPTQITVGGNGSFSISSDYLLTDEIDFVLDKTKNYLISFCILYSTADPYCVYVAGSPYPAGLYRAYGVNTCYAGGNTGSWSGYSGQQWLFSKIEVYQ